MSRTQGAGSLLQQSEERRGHSPLSALRYRAILALFGCPDSTTMIEHLRVARNGATTDTSLADRGYLVPREITMNGVDAALEAHLAIAAQSPEASILRLLVELGIQVVDGDEGSLLVLDAREHELVFSMVVTQDERSERSPLLGRRVPVGKGLTGLAAVTREVQIGAPTYVVGQEDKGGSGPQAVLAAPMLVRDECVGVLTAVSFRPGKRFHSRDAAIYGRLAAVAGVIVQQRRALSTAERTLSEREANSGFEQRVSRSLARIARVAPAAMGAVADAIEAIERVACGEEE